MAVQMRLSGINFSGSVGPTGTDQPDIDVFSVSVLTYGVICLCQFVVGVGMYRM